MNRLPSLARALGITVLLLLCGCAWFKHKPANAGTDHAEAAAATAAADATDAVEAAEAVATTDAAPTDAAAALAEGDKASKWNDTMVLSRDDGIWCIDDVEYHGQWPFANRGRLSDALKADF